MYEMGLKMFSWDILSVANGSLGTVQSFVTARGSIVGMVLKSQFYCVWNVAC